MRGKAHALFVTFSDQRGVAPAWQMAPSIMLEERPRPGKSLTAATRCTPTVHPSKTTLIPTPNLADPGPTYSIPLDLADPTNHSLPATLHFGVP
jgi:hypothetical protein